MNKVLLIFLIGLGMSCTKKEATNKQQQEEETLNIQTYGEAIDTIGAVSIDELPNLMTDQDSVTMTLVGEIEKTCAVKGCWMQLKTAQGDPLRVSFKDYAFFVPKSGVEGKTTTIQGYCKKQMTSIEELKHFAKDAGESEEYISGIIAPKMEYSFVANGVIIAD